MIGKKDPKALEILDGFLDENIDKANKFTMGKHGIKRRLKKCC